MAKKYAGVQAVVNTDTKELELNVSGETSSIGLVNKQSDETIAGEKTFEELSPKYGMKLKADGTGHILLTWPDTNSEYNQFFQSGNGEIALTSDFGSGATIDANTNGYARTWKEAGIFTDDFIGPADVPYTMAFDNSQNRWGKLDFSGLQLIIGLNDGSTLTNDIDGNAETASSVATINGKIAAGTNVTITGSGTAADPYEISAITSGSVGNLQAVTDNGFETTNPIILTNNYLLVKRSGNAISYFGSDSDAFGDSNNDVVNFVYGNNKYNIATNSVRRFTVDGSGNIGIGLTNPTEKLDVNGNALFRTNTNARIYIRSLNENNPLLSFEDASLNEQTGNFKAYNFNFFTNNTNRLSIDHSGNISATGNLNTSGDITVGGYSNFGSGFTSSGNSEVQADLNVTGNISAANFPVILSGSRTFDFGTIPANTSFYEVITVTGASVGDVVAYGAPASAIADSGLVIKAYVSTANNVTIVIRNVTGSGVSTGGTATWKVRVFK